MATPQVKDLVLRSPAGSSEVITFPWPLQVGSGQDRHDNGIDIIDTIKFVCDELPSISSAFEEINLNKIDTACYKTMTNLVDRFNKAVDSLVALEKGTSLPTKRLNKFAHPSLLRHILQLVYNAAVLDPEKLNIYEPFSPEVYGETSYELVQQIIKNVNVNSDDMFIDLGSGVGQVVLQMAGSFPLKSCIGIEKNETPAVYAERMDLFFRQFMAWFGKRYCEYKLIRGDFLIDEHREKITGSSLVFVNNFAFGPNLDHQLKERFADLKDGARVVSSKSFCPLNFRITDRNLSDIGTIMHVSEIPPLVGSVSWTCKPVSYYLHVIDRTKLERYFQRLKTQKSVDNDNHVGGSTRTTRDRAKREANNQALSHTNNSNNATNRISPPAIHINGNSTGKTRQQQQVQIQHSLDMDTSTESDTNGNSNGSGEPIAFKSWSDWGSSKGKSSQSDEEESNHFITRTTANTTRNNRTVTQRKRKKLARKVAIANKSAAAAAQREMNAKERADSLIVSNKNHHIYREDIIGGGNSTGGGNSSTTGIKGRKGRVKKGTRGRKSLKIVGLDVLHKETILSTSVEAMSKKKPAAPGTVDQQLTSLLTENMAHTELDIPAAPQDTPYALQILLDVFRSQYMGMIEQMKDKSFVPAIKQQIQLEQERKQRIKNRASQLDKQIKVLIDDSVALLKVRMNELGINVSSPNDLIAKAKEIVGRHKELQGIAKKIQSQVATCELEQRKLLNRHLSHLPDYQRLCVSGINGKIKMANDFELSEAVAREMVLKEIANTLTQRKKLKDQVLIIENETSVLEKSVEEKRSTALLIAQGTNITLANGNVLNNHRHLHHHLCQPSALLTSKATTPTSNINEPLQLKSNNSTSSSFNQSSNITAPICLKQGDSPCITTASIIANCLPTVTVSTTKSNNNNHCKASRRNRDHRPRSQEWPDVPEMGKIQESNPEILAQKILETGRKIEAGKYSTNNQNQSNMQINNNQQHLHYNNQYHHQHTLQRTDEKSSHRVEHHHHHQQQQQQQQQLQSQQNLKNHYHQRLNINEHQTADISYTNSQEASSLMPAPSKHRDSEGYSQNISTNIQQPSIPTNVSHAKQTGSITVKPELSTNIRKNISQPISLSIQESPKVANFEDRLKSIITSALNKDQEHRKAQQQMQTLHVDINGSSTSQQSPLPKRSKHAPAGANTPHLGPVHNVVTPNNSNNNSLSNIISVATHGVTHLNSTTTISPVAPPSTHVNNNLNVAGINNGAVYHNSSKYVNDKNVMNQPATKSNKYYQHLATNTNNNNGAYPNVGHNSYMTLRRRRNSINASTYEQFITGQQEQDHQQLYQEHAIGIQSHHNHSNRHQNHHQQLILNANNVNMTGINQYQHMQHHPTNSPQHPISLEFKAPPISNSENQQPAHQRSSNREISIEESARIHSTNTDTPLIHYPSNRERDRLVSSERSSSRDSTQILSQSSSHQPPSRPSSNSSQPDYTQVSPAKMALRRHLSQEKLNQQLPSGSTHSAATPMSTKTIGDLVNGEIERTLEEGIKLQSIINAAVNMSSLGNAAGERNVHTIENNTYSNERERTVERLIINPNVQRPERVHVRVVDDYNHSNSIDSTTRATTTTASLTERKSPYANNLVTLAHVAYQHKNIDAVNDRTSIQQRHYNNNLRERTVNESNNEVYHSHSTPMSGKLNGISNNQSNVKTAMNTVSKDYQPVALPRAEMKPCIEAYFQEKQQHLQNHHSNNLHMNHAHKNLTNNNNNNNSSKDGHHRMSSSKCNRLNGNNPPLEGLAASLQDRMMASRKFKEEHEERQRRAAASANMVSNVATTTPTNEHTHEHNISSSRNQNTNNNNGGREHYSPNNYGIASQSSIPSKRNNNSTTPCVKVELGVKRTSPMANTHHTIRPAKVPHYLHEATTMTTKNAIPYNNTNSVTLNHHNHQQPQQHISSDLSDHHKLSTTNNVTDSLLMSPDINTVMANNDQLLHLHSVANSRNNTLSHNDTNVHQALYDHHLHQHNSRHHNNYNSQHHQQHHLHHNHQLPLQSQVQHISASVTSASTSMQSPLTVMNNCTVSNSLITASRTADDDDVIADDETHWQHRVSSGFDRLVAFASTELDKTRRSIDGDIIPSSISCNTSPDSGITHSSSNSEASRTFLSTSSTSSQLEMPCGSGSSSSSSGNSSFLGHHTAGSVDHLSDSSMKSESGTLPITLKGCSSPLDTTAIESPPLSDMGLPRTPSPNVSLTTVVTPTSPPSSAATINLHNSNNNNNNTQMDKSVLVNNLKIPLKYQRKSKISSEKHYKKKFCERNWEYDCDDIMVYSNLTSNNITVDMSKATATATINGKVNDHIDNTKQSINDTASITAVATTTATASVTITAALSSTPSSPLKQQYHHHHKSSKFRPKGKDWDWSLDSNHSSNNTTIHNNNNNSNSNNNNNNNNNNSNSNSNKHSNIVNTQKAAISNKIITSS